LAIADLVLRSDVPRGVVGYEDYREWLRGDFWYSCAYCTVAETEAGALGFSIDHYIPRDRCTSLALTYENLMWCCAHCNSRKRAGPSLAALLQGYRFFCADTDDPDDHFAYSGQRIEGRTRLVGEYTVVALNLNRHTLRRVREARERLYRSRRAIAKGLRGLLGVSLQDLPRETRGRVEQVRKRLENATQALATHVDAALVKALSRSPFADAEQETSNQARGRRAYLSRINAAMPGAMVTMQVPSGKRPQVQRKR
jgi:hypothetical protein